MRRIVASTSLVLTLALVGCGGGSSGGVDGAGDDTQTPDAPPLVGDKYTLTWGPLTVPAGEEDTRCVTLKLSNAAAIKVHQFHNSLSAGSHHFIVYRDNNATQESTTPTHCNPFAGTLNPQAGASPLMITQRADEVLTLPDGVAYSFGADQFIRLEMHYINGSDSAVDVSATAEFYAVPEAAVHDEAEFLFIGSPDINLNLAPGASDTLQAYFPMPASLAGINFFAITGHTHKLGTDMDVLTAPSEGGQRTEVYNPTPFSWSEPETRRADFTVPSGGGFDFKCTWTNNTASTVNVTFGESANDEMCFFWTYYYPSKGAKVCVHTERLGTPFNGCCPDLGPTLCDAVIGP